MYRILNEIKKRVPNFVPQKILNYSAVPAASIIAAHEVYNDGYVTSYNNSDHNDYAGHTNHVNHVNYSTSGKFEKIVTVEPSEHLTAISKYLIDYIPNTKHLMLLYDQLNTFNLIIVSHTLLSLYDHESRHLFIKNLWNKLEKKGILIIVENGTPTGFRMLHSIREEFITELKHDKFHIVAPCPHESICPLALTGKDWCHFSQSVLRLSHHIYCKGSHKKNVDEEKFSYLVIQKSEGPRTKYQTEQNALTAQEKSFFWPRVVMPTIKAGKHVLIDVCSYPYNFERLVVTKKSSLLVNLKTKSGTIIKGCGYKKARKIRW
uniref:Mitochondrial ribosomal protein S22 n=1 Tax=Piliocolobus tephrosceles TaxID=591936 RepID=A0A8C9GRX0_9PRIM